MRSRRDLRRPSPRAPGEPAERRRGAARGPREAGGSALSVWGWFPPAWAAPASPP